MDALAERDIIVAWIPSGGMYRFGDRTLPPADAKAMQKRFNAENRGFRVVLIGKDGGIKRDNGSPPLLVDVLGQILMPMRQQEMRVSKYKNDKD